MGAEAGHRVEQSGRAGIVPDDIPVDGRRVEGLARVVVVVFFTGRQRSAEVLVMPGRLQIGVDQPQGLGQLRYSAPCPLPSMRRYGTPCAAGRPTFRVQSSSRRMA